MQFARNMKVRMKLLGAFSFMSIIIILIGYLGIYNMDTINGMLGTLYKQEMTGLSLVKEANINLIYYSRSTSNFLLAATEAQRQEHLAKLDKHRGMLEENLQKATALINSEEGQRLVAQLKDEFAELEQKQQAVTEAVLAGQMQTAREVVDQMSLDLRNTADKVDTLLSQLARMKEDNGQQYYNNSNTIYADMRSFLLLVTLISIVIGLALGYLIARLISNPVTRLKEAAEKVAAGDTSVVVDVPGTDELGMLSRSFNTMVERLRLLLGEMREKEEYLSESVDTMVTEMERFADGDLTVRLHARKSDNIGRLYTSFNQAIGNIRNLMTQVYQAVDTTAAAAAEISASTEQLAAGTQEQSAQSFEIAAAVEEMARTITENSHSATRAATLADNNGQAARDGNRIVDVTVEKMQTIADIVQHSAATVERLGASGNTISEITSVIDDIANQTNLLALNAAIEAARAGEHGRGFAVVADEVRKLAERTSRATGEIGRIVTSIQKETQESVLAIRHGTSEVSEGSTLVHQASTALSAIVGSSGEVLAVIGQIASASEEQSATSEQLARSMEGMSAVISQSAQGVNQIATAANNLSTLTENLNTLIGRFTLDNDKLQFHADRPTTPLHRNGWKPVRDSV